ncbi:glycosyltransferase family 39 protein [Desulfuromonas sp. KJ2020]|uniref:tetratricopeptide repeat protein n=1 Tax=Desulfuromonas sp. KJ2020 TaxID=2919173 RepID=UPI0020A72410|nr:glycosyltransferase family 39 protein [Desulfuromonas sp. KJ2020]MCP3177405.1 glycosyltransferase family 39 protein [Desulfuromonas sp. KJ2020]
MRLRTWHCLCLIGLFVLLAYYPTVHAGYNSVDDLKMVTNIDRAGPLDLERLERLFVRSGSYYYRPLTILTYTLDRDLWGSIPSFMHLGNILLHLVNALLVFAITRQLFKVFNRGSLWPALFAGLFFALHPLATESVAWISGRTDLLMSVFLLLAVWLTLLALESKHPVVIAGAGVSLFVAPLAKEVAVFILPGMLWLIAVYPGEGRLLGRLQQRWLLLASTVGSVVAYFSLRALAIERDSGIKTALKGIAGSDGHGLFEWLDKVRVAFKVYGFYFKKLFVPWPLNFGIVEISGWYILVGVLLAMVLLYLAWRADVLGSFGLMAFCVLSPALLIVFGKMAWTPLSERYLYAPVALFAPLAAFFAVYVKTKVAPSFGPLVNILLIAGLAIFFSTTVHRAWIWQDNVRLYRDTVAKSPNFPPAKSELASALLKTGSIEEAKKILGSMQVDDSPVSYISDDINLAYSLAAEGELDEARQMLLPLLKQNPKKRFDVLQSLIRVNDMRLGKEDTPEGKAVIHRENLDWLLEQQRLKPQVFTLYRIGKRYLALEDEAKALDYFKKVYAQAPQDAHYRGAAATQISRLESQ